MDVREEKYIPPLMGETANLTIFVIEHLVSFVVLRFYFHQFEVHRIILCLKELSYEMIILSFVFISGG